MKTVPCPSLTVWMWVMLDAIVIVPPPTTDRVPLPVPPFIVAPMVAAVTTYVSVPAPPFTVWLLMPRVTVSAPDPRLMMSASPLPPLIAKVASLLAVKS